MVIMPYLVLAITFLFMFAMGLLVPALLVLSYSRFGAGLSLVFGIYIVDALMMGSGTINVGINLFFPDIVLGLIAAVAGLRLIFISELPDQNRAWLCFCTLIVVSLLTGLISFGTAAGVQARAYFYFMVSGLYAMSFTMDEKRLRLVFNALTVSAFVFVLLAFYRWIVYYTPIEELLPPGGIYNVDGAIRVVYSSNTLVIAQMLVCGLFFAAAARGYAIARFVSPVLLGTVLVLQHRSVWLAAMVGVLVRLLLGNSKSGSAAKQIVLVGAIIAVTAVPLVFSDKLSGVTQQVGASASNVLAGKGTAGERLNSWREIIKNWYTAGPRSILIGQSFGSDNTRYVEDSRGGTRKIDYLAHNFYVQTLFNTGLLGLGAFLLAAWYVMTGLYRICRAGHGGVEAEVLLVLMAMQLAYYIPYGTDYLQSFIFGISLAYVAGKDMLQRQTAIEGARQGAWT